MYILCETIIVIFILLYIIFVITIIFNIYAALDRAVYSEFGVENSILTD